MKTLMVKFLRLIIPSTRVGHDRPQRPASTSAPGELEDARRRLRRIEERRDERATLARPIRAHQ